MQDLVPLNELFSTEEINNIIDKGLSLGIERARDENIDVDVTYSIQNGNDKEMNQYANRLNNKSLNENEQSIIDRYKDM